jgi:protein O-mannosyl-transferase
MFLRGRSLPVWQGGLIVFLVFLAYLPALQGGFVWDDDDYVVNNLLLHSLKGLSQIWFAPGTTPQYYPLSFTSFWLDYHLWKLNPLGYHLTNLLFQAINAILLWTLLRRLSVPGAWLAAAIFAIHPVNVESVAWITERKNVLAGFFYLSSALACLQFWLPDLAAADSCTQSGPQTTAAGLGNWKFYWLALLLYLCALLAKTATIGLPVAVLLVVWWKRGKMGWRALFPLAPFLAVGMGMGLLTVWVEKHFVHAAGSEWTFSLLERCLIAGRAVWFYLGKLVWPHPLMFVYPRWDIHAARPLAYLPVLALLVVLFILWLNRKGWARPMLVALACFLALLFPVLGFFDVYFFRYSFVADHFQYLAGIGPLTLAAAGITLAFKKTKPVLKLAGGGALLLTLGLLTWQQAGIYRNMETLWRTTLARNPDCWMAHSNLGLLLKNQGHIEEAIEHYHLALQIAPNAWDALNDLGVALADKGQFDEAIEYYHKSLQIDPNLFAVQNNLGHALAAEGRFDEAIEYYRKALQISPNFSDALNNLGNALAARGRFDEAIDNYRKAVQVNPDFSEALNNLGVALATRGRFDEAIDNYRKAIQINPNDCDALNNLGMALAAKGRFDEAIENYRKAIQINSNRPETFFHLGMTLDQLGRTREAVAQYREAMKLNPNLAGPLNNLAWVLAAGPDDELRNGPEAVRLAQRACELTHYGEPLFIGTLAAAYAECGRFPEAVATAEKAEQLATTAGAKDVAGKIRQLLELYRAGKPFHEPAPTGQ